MSLDPAVALQLTTRLAALAALVGCLELGAARAALAPGGAFGLSGALSMHWRGSRFLRLVGGRELALLVVGAASAAALVGLGPFHAAGMASLVVTLLVRLAIAQRRIIGSDGAEQLVTITLIAALLGTFPQPDATRINLAVAFIGAQLVLAYFTSGVAKLASSSWRRGTALAGILGTQTYGLRSASGLLGRIPRGSLLLGWGVMLFETVFVLSLFGPDWMLLAALACALLFHLSCAVIMGLNDFLLAFPATFPCVVVLGQWLGAS